MKKKIIYGIIALLIIAGAIVVFTKGFNFSLNYQANQKIELYIEEEFETSDIKAITDEVLEGKQVVIQKVEVYKDMVSIASSEITDEEKASIVEKVNEKYSLELEADDITIDSVPHTRLRDILKPYVLPGVLSALLILVYIEARFYKLGIASVMLKTILATVVGQLAIFSVMAITRFPIGEFTMAIALFVYLLTMLAVTSNFEKNLAKIKEEEKTEE
jgi:preprotein translocase subunit SecF